MAEPVSGEVFALVTVGRDGLLVTVAFENARAAWRYAVTHRVAHRSRPARIAFDTGPVGPSGVGSPVAGPLEVPMRPLPALVRAAVVGWWRRRPSWAASA